MPKLIVTLEYNNEEDEITYIMEKISEMIEDGFIEGTNPVPWSMADNVKKECLFCSSDIQSALETVCVVCLDESSLKR